MHRTTALALTAAMLPMACDPEPAATGTDEVDLEEALAQYCEEAGDCADGKHDAVTLIVQTAALWRLLVEVVKAKVDFEALSERWCTMPDRFTHFVDYAADVDGVPQFTSVQDFTIERTDIEPADVLRAFHGDWLDWWENGGTDPETVGAEGPGVWHQEIRPLKLSMVSIVMDVHDVEVDPEHPRLRNPERDALDGESLAWDAGIRIEMSPGNAFQGTMVVLARRTPEGIHVRELWHDVEPLSPLVMEVVPFVFSLTRAEALAIPPALHIISLQGCAPIVENTGYPGLIEAFESGRVPATSE